MTTAWSLDDYSTLDLETSDATAVPIAGVQNVTIIPSVSIEQLYTGDSIKIDDQMQHEFSVNVQIGYSKWDSTVIEQWLGGSGSIGSSMSDTTDPQKYKLTGTFVERGGANQLDAVVTGITFEEMPLFDASRGEYVQWDLEGTGEDINSVATSATA